jgi:hypothetical protein
MKAIFTKYYGPTNFKGARINASDSDGNRVIVSVPVLERIYGGSCKTIDIQPLHLIAARQLCVKMGWNGELVSGGTRNGYVHVFAAPEVNEDE